MPLAIAVALALALALASQEDASARLEAKLSPEGPGCVLGVDRPGVPPLLRALGRADLEQPAPITSETVFEAGSVSKQFTAAAVAVLAAQGVLSLDDDVRRWLPELPPYAAPITLRRLADHTSGLRNWDDLVELQGWPEGRAAHRQAEVVRLIARQRATNFAPGAEYAYSNSNYVLLAEIVARASGQSFAAFSREALFKPLGLDHTRWRDDFTALVLGRAQAYSKDGQGGWRLDMPFVDVVGQGGLLTTAADLLRWNAVLSAPPAAAAGWVKLMTERGRLADGTQIAYGLGLEFERVAGQAVISHAGATAGYRSYLARATAAGVSLALLCNDGELNTEDLGPDLLAAFLPPAPDTPLRLVPAPALDLPPYTGAFRDPRSEALIPVTAKDGGLSLDGGPVWRPVEPGVFRNASGSRRLSFDDARARIRFTRGGNAPVELVRIAPAALKPLPAAGYRGAFKSDELNAVSRFEVEGDGLVRLDPSGDRHLLKPLYRDVFEDPAEAWTIAFRRDAKGRITAVDLSAPRTRKVRFTRVR